MAATISGRAETDAGGGLDFGNVKLGESVVGLAGVALAIIMTAVDWYGVEGLDLLPVFPDQAASPAVEPRNAFESFAVIDLVLLLTVLAACALPLLSAARLSVDAARVVVAAFGLVAATLILIRIIGPPDLVVDSVHVSEVGEAEVTTQAGAWAGLVAAAAIAGGGYVALRQSHALRRSRGS